MKHTKQFKRAAIKRYLEGTRGYKLVAREYSIAPAVLRRWVLWYRMHGGAGLTRKTGQYTADFKLTVLRHMWDNGFSLTQVAAVFNVGSPHSVASWARRYRDGGFEGLGRFRKPVPIDMQAPPNKSEQQDDNDTRSREDLLKELEYLRAENAYLKKLDALFPARPNPTTRKKRK